MYRSLNPYTEEVFASFELCSEKEVEEALERSAQAFAPWRECSFSQRAEPFLRLSELLRSESATHARLISLEMGKPFAQAEAEVLKCADACQYFATNSAELLAPEIRPRYSGGEAEIGFAPLGPLLAIMPWNFPFYQVFRFASPALMAGNTLVVKHSPNTPSCAKAIAELFQKAAFPEGVYQSLFLSNEQVEEVISDSRIRGVTLTGSERAGRLVGSTASKHLKPLLLELGGSDPFIVLRDADIEQAAAVGVASRCANAGQVCCSAKRFIIDASVYPKFIDVFLEKMDAQVLGDPLEPSVTMGPLAREDLRERLREQISAMIRQGGKVLTEQSPPQSKGFFVGPLALEIPKEQYKNFSEEVFGPVALLYQVESEEEAIELANCSPYGLSASIWSEDTSRAQKLARRIEAGTVVLNGSPTSDFAIPFGGVKDSGFGRELGREGIRMFVNTRAIWL